MSAEEGRGGGRCQLKKGGEGQMSAEEGRGGADVS